MKKSTKNTLLVIEVILNIIGLFILVWWCIKRVKSDSEDDIEEFELEDKEEELSTEHTPLGRKYITIGGRDEE